MPKEKVSHSRLRQMLLKTLKHEIGGRDCVLLDLPNYYNPGDQLIWEGEEQLLKALKIKVTYRASLHFFNPLMVGPNTCILLQGGGNFGDLYPKHQQFRQYVVQRFPNHKIIILPVTIHFSSPTATRRSFSILDSHPHLVICVRDKVSFKLLLSNFPKDRSYLLPDTAYGITTFKRLQSPVLGATLYLCRRDREEKNEDTPDLASLTEVHVSDWPEYTRPLLGLHLFILYLNRAILKLYQLVTGSHWSSRHDVYGVFAPHTKERQIAGAIKLLSKYNHVYTSRLHGHILCDLLGIENTVVDNSYGKNKNYLSTWS